MRKLITLAAAAFTAFTAAALALGGASAASASAHPQAITGATSVCGSLCYDVSTVFAGPAMIQDAHDGFAQGDRIFLRKASNTRTNEDFEASFTGIVGTTFEPGSACFAGLLPATSKLCLDGAYSSDPVWQLVGAPDSNATDLCVGVSSAAVGQKLRLEPCNNDLATLWVGDSVNGDGGGEPFINGADTSFANPLVAEVIPGVTNGITDQMELAQENPAAGVVNDHKQVVVSAGPFD
jgi:hypothetical protein